MTEFGDINITGGNNVNQFGDGNTGNQTNNISGESDWRVPFIELQEQVADKEWPEKTPAPIVERYKTPKLAVAAATAEIEKDLAREDDAPVESDESFEERKKTWGETFKAIVPMGVKLTSSVGMALAGHFTKKTAAGVAAEAFFTTINELSK